MSRHWIFAAVVMGAALTVAANAAPLSEFDDSAPVVAEEAVTEEASDEAAQEPQPQPDPETAEAYRNRGIELLKEQKYREAANELNQAIKIDPKDAYAHYYLGMANSRLKKKDLMVKHFQIFLELAPDAPEAERVRSLLKSL